MGNRKMSAENIRNIESLVDDIYARLGEITHILEHKCEPENFAVPMHKVDSSTIDYVGYQTWTSSVFVKFLNGDVYKYTAVDREVFDELLNAPSPGSYLNNNFKGTYAYEKVVG